MRRDNAAAESLLGSFARETLYNPESRRFENKDHDRREIYRRIARHDHRRRRPRADCTSPIGYENRHAGLEQHQ